jgi:hypothetical protein
MLAFVSVKTHSTLSVSSSIKTSFRVTLAHRRLQQIAIPEQKDQIIDYEMRFNRIGLKYWWDTGLLF